MFFGASQGEFSRSAIMVGYVCRVCGNEALVRPWDDPPRYFCEPRFGGCGVTNMPPLLAKEPEEPA